MAYYTNDQAWAAAPGRQASWEQPQTPSRSGMSTGLGKHRGTIMTTTGASSTVNRGDEAIAFVSQFDGMWRLEIR